MKYKKYTIPDKEIDKLIDKLDISLSEACEIYLSDKDLITNETIHELTEMARKNKVTNTIHNAKGERKERKPKEKKENPLKKAIISQISQCFYDELWDLPYNVTEVNTRNKEKYIDLVIDGRNFTINLVEHRQKKGEK